MVWHHKSNLKLIGETILKISRSQGVSIAYILKSSMVAILVFTYGPKSMASLFSEVQYHISKLKSIGETVLVISRSQVGRTEGWPEGWTDWRTEGWTDYRHFYVLPKFRLRRTKIKSCNAVHIAKTRLENKVCYWCDSLSYFNHAIAFLRNKSTLYLF